MREDQVSGGCVDCSFEVGDQLGRDRDDVVVTSFRGVVAVRVPNVDEAMVEIHVGLRESEQLALA
jgi:hypothetical protein